MKFAIRALVVSVTFFSFYSRAENKSFSSSVYLASVGVSSSSSNGTSKNLSISSNGRYIAFESNATNLVSGDTNNATDVFVFDKQTGTTVRASVDSSGAQANGKSYNPAISGNGQFVVFISTATNLISSDTNFCSDVFVRDLVNNTTIRVSVGAAGAEANSGSDTPSITDDGQYVGFRSEATNLIGSGDTNDKADFFVHDISGGITSIVSVDSSGNLADDDSFEGKISGDGSSFVFTSKATNLVSGDSNQCTDVFLRNLSGSTTVVLSINASSVFGDRASSNPDISNDGRFVVFQSRAGNLVSGDTNKYSDIFLVDRTNSTIERASLKTGESQIHSESINPKISDDGRFIVFSSFAGDLDALDANHQWDVFLRDRASKLTTIVSSTSSVVGNSWSNGGDLSGDGTVLAFSSLASNLVVGDSNARTDVFYRFNLVQNNVIDVFVKDPLVEEDGTQDAFEFRRYGNTSGTLAVSYTVSGTATAGVDYSTLSGSITFGAGESSKILQVTTFDDSTVEAPEYITIEITPSSSIIPGGSPSAQNHISSSEQFTVSVVTDSNIVTEDGGVKGKFTLTRTGGTLGDLNVPISILGSAALGVDYSGITSVLTIPDGQSAVQFEITGIKDEIAESDESISISLNAGAGYTLGSPASVALTVKDSNIFDASVSALDPIAVEGDSGNTGVFRISLSGSTPVSLPVFYVMKGTATNGIDYTFLTGVATVPANESYVDVTITSLSDSIVEGIETAEMELLEGPNYRVDISKFATVLIQEISTLPVVSVETLGASATEDGVGVGKFRISRTGVTTSALTVNFNVAGSAISGMDYNSIGTSISIPISAAYVDIDVEAIDDGLTEDDETVLIAISSAPFYEVDVSKFKATVTINDDDEPLVSVFTRSSLASDSLKKNGELVFTRSGDLTNSLTVYYSVTGTATSSDYNSIGSSVTFLPFEKEHSVFVTAKHDSAIEGTKSLILTISSDSAYSIADASTAQIRVLDSAAIFSGIAVVAPNNDIKDVSISDDGRYIVFSSKASNISPTADTNGVSDIFIVDTTALPSPPHFRLQTGISGITRILTPSGQEPNGESYLPRISSDGRYIVFVTRATNFFDDDTYNNSDIVLFDRQLSTYRLVSKGIWNRTEFLDSTSPYISSNGRYIIFSSSEPDLVLDDTNEKEDIFLHDVISNSTIRANSVAGHPQFISSSFQPTVSDSGKLVVFTSTEQIDGDSDDKKDVILVDLENQNIKRISNPSSGTKNSEDSFSPVISPDGANIFYISQSRNLVPNFVSGTPELISYNIAEDKTKILSQSQDGSIANSAISNISGNNNFASFVTSSRNLSSLLNCTSTTFVKNLFSNQMDEIDYSDISLCRGPILQSRISFNSKFIVSVASFRKSLGKEGHHEILVSSNPLYDGEY